MGRKCQVMWPLWLLISVALVLINSQTGASTYSKQQRGESQDNYEEFKLQRPNEEFILLTTGEHIKLYPLVEKNGQLAPSNDPYFVIAKPISITGEPKSLNDSNKSSYIRWLEYRARKQANRDTRTINSMKDDPIRVYEDEDFGDSGWQKPLVNDVDYYFDDQACKSHQLDLGSRGKCLVIVWIDKRNKLIRSGLVNLQTSSIKFSRPVDGLAKSKRRYLILNEILPVDLCEDRSGNCELKALNAERSQGQVSLLLLEGREYFIKKLNGLRYRNGHIEWVHNYLHDLRVGEKDSYVFDNSKFLIDGDRSFLFNKSVLRVGSLQMNLGSVSVYTNETLDSPEGDDITNEFSAIGIDSDKKLLVWLNKLNELRSSKPNGSGNKMIMKLPPKPVIRSPDNLRVYGNRVYISDRAKKTLILCQIGDTTARGRIDQPKVEVLLVESPGILSFRIGSAPEENLKSKANLTFRPQVDETSTEQAEDLSLFYDLPAPDNITVMSVDGHDLYSCTLAIYTGIIASLAMIVVVVVLVKRASSAPMKTIDLESNGATSCK